MTRLEEIGKGATTLVLHINYGNGYGYVRRSVVEPRLTVASGGPKGRKSKFEAYRRYAVDGIEGVFATLEEAVLAIERLDQQKQRDAEWDAAKPKRPKPAALPDLIP